MHKLNMIFKQKCQSLKLEQIKKVTLTLAIKIILVMSIFTGYLLNENQANIMWLQARHAHI